MSANCEYCGATSEAAGKCAGCGAPAAPRAPADFRSCPHCRRRLLSLASANCNYCGRQLPADYIEARSGQLRRISEINPPPKRVEDEERGGDDLDLSSLF